MPGEIGEQLGYVDLGRRLGELSYLIPGKDWIKFQGRELLELKKILNESGIGGVVDKTNSFNMLCESGLYKIVARSNKPMCLKFFDWVMGDVMPTLRRTGSYGYTKFNQIEDHVERPVQIQNSKDINDFNYHKKGSAKDCITYNIDSCMAFTGRSPKQVMSMGKEAGLKSKERTSAKEVLRHTQPEVACAMSFVDNMIKQGVDRAKVLALAKEKMLDTYKAILECKFEQLTVNELSR